LSREKPCPNRDPGTQEYALAAYMHALEARTQKVFVFSEKGQDLITKKELRSHREGAEETPGGALSKEYGEFLGRSLVHLAHDFKNHLATINESAGLMGDLLRLRQKKAPGRIRRFFSRGPGPSFNPGPLLEELSTIQEEAWEGSALVQELGELAHRMEENRSLLTETEEPE